MSSPTLGSRLPGALRVLGLSIGAILVAILVIVLARKLWTYSIYSYLSHRLHDDVHLDSDLADAIAFIIWIPFAYFLGLSLNLFGKSKRLIGAIGLSLYFAGFSLASYVVDKNVYFTSSGPAKYVAITPEGCVFSDEPGVDPRSGSKRRAVTPTIVEACQGSSGFENLNQIPMLYDVDTGEPLVWYAHDPVDGTYRFFLSPGFDARTGGERKRLSGRDLEAIRRELQERERLRQAQIAAEDAERSKNMQTDPPILDSTQPETSTPQSPTLQPPLRVPPTQADPPAQEPYDDVVTNRSLDGQWRLIKNYTLNTCNFDLPQAYTLYLSERNNDYFRVSMKDGSETIWEYHDGHLNDNTLRIRAYTDIMESSDRHRFQSEFTGTWQGDRIEGKEKIDIVNECFLEATWSASRIR